MADIFGPIAEAISPAKLKQIQYSDTLNNLLNQTTANQLTRQAADATDLAALSGAAKGAAKNIEGLTLGDQSLIGSLINSRVDPFQTYQNVGDYQFNILDRLAGGLADQGRSGESRRQAALGYGGRGGSTYGSNTLLDRISRNLSPVYASTLGNLSSAASNIDANRITQDNNVLNLIGARAAAPTRSLPMYSLPIAARSQINDDQLRTLLGLGQGYKTNSAGFKEQKSALGNIGTALDGVVNTGVDLASIYAGGGSGGALGGIFGGGGKAQPAAQPWYMGGMSGNSYGPYSYGNYGGGYQQPSPWMANFGWQGPVRN